MPAVPEIRDTLGEVGVLEVFADIEAKNTCHSPRHIGIGRKVTINVRGEANSGD